jgi:hypothetical protein
MNIKKVVSCSYMEFLLPLTPHQNPYPFFHSIIAWLFA